MKIATWNINSVRLRLPLIFKYIGMYHPDILCLQEIKCVNSQFPCDELAACGYIYQEVSGQKGYHGVAIVSRVPFSLLETRRFCDVPDCRHIAVGFEWGGRKVRIDNFYVPAGGDIADVELNPKFRHKLNFLDEMRSFVADAGDGVSRLLVGDLNIAPLEHDVWSHKQLLDVVSHTPVETEALQNLCKNGGWVDLLRAQFPEPCKLYTWWSYRARDWAASNRGRRLDHMWSSADLATKVDEIVILKDARGWDRPSDHVPILAKFII